MLILHKPRANALGYRTDPTARGNIVLKPTWLFHDVFWAGEHGIFVFKGDHEASITSLAVMTPNGGRDAQTLALLEETETFCRFAAPKAGTVFATLCIVFSDNTAAIEENVEDLSTVWPVRFAEQPPGTLTKISWSTISGSNPDSLGVPKHRGRPDQPRTHVTFAKCSLDANDVVQLLDKPGLITESMALDDNLFIIVAEWRPLLGEDGAMEIYSNKLSSALEPPPH